MKLDQPTLQQWIDTLENLRANGNHQPKQDASLPTEKHHAWSASEIADRQLALEQILLRNQQLNLNPRVFVSCRFDSSGGTPDWLNRVLDRVNNIRQLGGYGKVRFVFGKANPPQDFHMFILKLIVECSCFVGVISATKRGSRFSADASPWLSEEAGAAFALAKPMIFAVEQGLDPDEFGKFLGHNWQRLWYSQTVDGEAKFGSELRDAIEAAPEAQRGSIEMRRKIVARLFQ